MEILGGIFDVKPAADRSSVITWTVRVFIINIFTQIFIGRGPKKQITRQNGMWAVSFGATWNFVPKNVRRNEGKKQEKENEATYNEVLYNSLVFLSTIIMNHHYQDGSYQTQST